MDPPPTPEDAMAWRLRRITVFMPVHQRMTDLVFLHADLIEEPEMPPCLLAMCAHVAGYQAIIEEWESGETSVDRNDNVSVVNFPGHALATYASAAIGRLKAEQNALLGSAAATAP